MAQPPAKLISFAAGIAATAATLTQFEESDESFEYGPVRADAFQVGICAGVFLTAYAVAATALGVVGGD